MRQLTALDAQFLNVETATTAAHVAGLAILDAADGRLNRQALADLLLERLHLAPALQLRLVEVPLGLDHPYWAGDPEFDIDNHLFEMTLPAPGGERELAEAVAEIHARRLDRTHPLWEMHLINGLAGGKAGVYTKVHHAAIDGVSGAETLAALLDLAPETGPLPHCATRTGKTSRPAAVSDDKGDGVVREMASARPKAGAAGEEAPGLLAMLAGAAANGVAHPGRALRSVMRAAGDLDAIPLAATVPGSRLIARAARKVAGDPRERPPLPSLTAPRTPFNGPISPRRHLAFGSVSWKDVKSVARASGMSGNDVVMALCTTALRAWLLERDALPDEPLIAAVPVAVRSAGAQERVGNQISAMIAPLPTTTADPEERLRVVGQTMSAAKRRFALAPTSWLSELCAVLPSPVTGLVTPAIFRFVSAARPPVNLIISNVPGPQFPLYLCGSRVLSYYPMSVLSDATGGVNITCFSYDGMLDFGVVACPERMDDVWSLLDHLRRALDELVDRPDEYHGGRDAFPH
ncbi:WS/DGAT/MGAT family O-acyltransferase [Nonomuraea ferruginea]|uniref:diacylglycerol O-acyltransferase n=1 Tax=Nonomuraea ferruginea TaxID=46174 RepID=A0ABT4T9L2_9ACTN|nr:wax ester/triacylglycerol synthase family O-acyltransferase [Nonomuraea ferruginea]MDA0646201.1 wax ester/triacylglycerol synthase family O-acyltransferase [Nonomuraea ferruginea]